MILEDDHERIVQDAAYREDLRHRFITDHFFAGEMLGWRFHPILHQPVKEFYFPKNPGLPIEEQDPKPYRLHLDPRFTYKTTFGRVDKVQWVAAFPKIITMLNETATQPLAKAISKGIANYFYCPKYSQPTRFQLCFPELVVDKAPFSFSDTWSTKNHDMNALDETISFTSPQTEQSGWHPWILNCDDMVATKNSGIRATQDARQGVIETFDTNKNTLVPGGYMYLTGTRYHPFDLYGVRLGDMDPDMWKVLIRHSLTRKDGSRLLPGEFPPEDEVTLHFAELPGMTYKRLRSMFHENYETFMCFTAGHRVLMADWTEKAIEDMKVGDEVIGLEKNGRYDSRLVKTKVVRTFARRAAVVESTTECGRKVRHTPDHRFLRPSNGGAMRYVKLKVGCKTVSVYKPTMPPTAAQQRDLDWLGGMLDGEGSISQSLCALHQKESSNPEVYEAIGAVLDRLGIAYTMGKTHKTDRFSLLGGRSLLIWLLNHARMMKLNRFHQALWSSRQHSETTGRGGGPSQPKIISIAPIGEQMVYDIETETHNFVCEGFAVHNCQQQNDPQGGHTPTFDEKLYGSCETEVDRIPMYGGEVFVCWRIPYGSKAATSKFVEGAAARIIAGKVYVIDCWRIGGTPSHQAERMIQIQKEIQGDGLMLLSTPGSESFAPHLRNEAGRRNLSLRIQWTDWEDNENLRANSIKQLEPMLKVGRVLFSRDMNKGSECKKQFVHFGLVEENGIIECVSKLADMVPISQLRANMEEEELDWQRRRREDAMLNSFLQQQGMPQVDEQAKQKAAAHIKAMQKATTWGLPPMPGGLDG